MNVFERNRLDNGLRVLSANMPQVQSVTCMIMLAAGSRYETPETNGIAHFAEHMFFKGTERRPDRAGHRHGGGQPRRRVQRLHGQGVHGLLRPLRRRLPRPGARRARRHAAQLEVRARGDRAREGRDRRGDEHVLRHAARLHQRRLRGAALRRPAARLGHHRAQGDGARREAGDVPRLHRPLVQAGADGRRPRGEPRRRLPGLGRAPARRPGARGDRRAARGLGRTAPGTLG